MSGKYRVEELSSEEEGSLHEASTRFSHHPDSDTDYDTSDTVLGESSQLHSSRREHRDARRSFESHGSQRHSSGHKVHEGSSGPQCFGTADSISTIEGVGGGPNPDEIAKVYQELQVINNKLKQEFKLLHERDLLQKEKDEHLVAREKTLSADKADFETLVVNEVKRRLVQREQEHQLALERQDLQLKEKSREHKRLKENFDTLKIANDTLRKELDTVQKQYGKMEKQTTSLQARLINMQRRREQGDPTEADFLPLELAKKKSEKTAKDKVAIAATALHKPASWTATGYDILGVLLEWVSEVNLRHAITDEPTKPLEGFTSTDFLQEKCFKVLPPLADLLRELPMGNPSLMLPCLQFLYWSLRHTENSQNFQRTSLTSTLRRLGGELYKPRIVKFSDEGVAGSAKTNHDIAVVTKAGDKVKEGLYFRSASLHIRFLSSLIILQTITQVDHVAHVFEVLKGDLKTGPGKELFLHYQATPVLLPYLRPSSKAFVNIAMDVYLHLTMESPVLPGFLQSCSNEAWFRACSMLFRMPNVEEKLLEKISIVLQKLSKIRNNKRYFDVFGLTTACQELLRTVGVGNGFLTLNLKSILFNLNTKPAAMASSMGITSTVPAATMS